MRTRALKGVKKEGKTVSYCREVAETVKEGQLPKKDALRMKRKLGKKDEAASYCCEAANTLSAEKLPPEDAF